MKHVTMIEMEGCPYCAKAHRAIGELVQKDPRYGALTLQYVDENRDTDEVQPFAGKYYYVPSLFIDGEKGYEAQPGQDYEEIYAAVKQVFDQAIGK